METRELICIGCPLGCPLTVRLDGEQLEISGNTCKRGEDYARKEVQNPTRIVTSTVRVTGGDVEMVSVKTKDDLPKGKKGSRTDRGRDSPQLRGNRDSGDRHQGGPCGLNGKTADARTV